MIEVIERERCISCDLCIEVCPTRVFDRGADGVPVIARHDSCQTCFQCEAYCPTDALFVAPLTAPAPPDAPWFDVDRLVTDELLGSYRHALGWNGGKLGARAAVGPELPG